MNLFRKKLDFKAQKYIDDNYIKNDKAVISMDIKDNSMFYDKLDFDRLTLASDITSFIDNRIDYILYRYQIVLKFHCKEMEQSEKEKIVEMIRAHYGLEANERNYELRINNIKSFTLFVIGVFFLAIASLASPYGFLIKEILSIAGWVAMWEMVTSVLFGTIKLKVNKYDATRLSDADIQFIVKNN